MRPTCPRKIRRNHHVFLDPGAFKLPGICLLAGIALAALSCPGARPTGGTATPPDVEVVTVEQSDVPIYGEWVGTLHGLVDAAVRAQITGYLLKQDYKEGSFVRAGDLLFEIDPRPFQAVLDHAQAQLAQARGQVSQAEAQGVQIQAQIAVAEANQGKAQLDVDRYTPLANQEAISQQELENAVQNNLAAKAQVQATKAALEVAKAQLQAANAAVQAASAAVETARLNLEFTRLTAPIDGIAGVAQQQVGNLVSPSSGPVVTISTVDPIKVYFTPGEREYLAYSGQFASSGNRGSQSGFSQLELILADGSVYPEKGRFFFVDREVNQSTGAILLAGLFPNPGNVLRPGQYGRVRAVTATRTGALLVPQRAVTELQGSQQVAVVDAGNKIAVRSVKLGERVGNMWIVQEGLRPGERVVAEGVQKAAPGTRVNPRPFTGQTEPKGR